MGTAIKKIDASLMFIKNAIIKEKTIIKGALIAILIIIWNDIWILFISVVCLVTILDVENLSILEKEKSWTL